ncbi:rod shape determining protein RodA [Rhizomicrobium palustre]|uniref:Peptidoglycan glycosyltransferase MrdB n=1 Tax=Rhizomicrobium palustre TaxID=189966 RepID=A0A846MWN0_9PROT|nr:rod shape-determining protein RodA [Rhizomicrobium palustre]NIK87440.1 rod shape determining protein RodA [Rhizomicrobium palustre]
MLRPYAAARRHLSIADKLYELNWGLVLLIAIIASIGIAMLYSVAGGSWSPWASSQAIKLVLGFFMMIVVAMVDIRVWMNIAYPFYAASLLLLLGVELMGMAHLGAQRWITLGPLELQPSEPMKIALILALAKFMHGQSVEDISKPLRLMVPLAMIAMPAALVAMQPNLGTTIILVLDGCSLLFLAGLSWWWIAPVITGVAAAIPVAWRFVLHDYQKARVMTFMNPESDALGAGWNITQAKIAVGSGGAAGKGFLQGTQSRLNFLPEKQTDFIITNFAEEFGFVGCIALLILFGTVIGYGVQTAIQARSQFGRLVAMGITLNFFFYIMINGMMVMGLIPVVGIPMPLISYGGTALLAVMFGFGILLSVHIHRQVEIPRHSTGII